ncbi:reverse transcriptase domain-containing protein [Tanacetum coccineum]
MVTTPTTGEITISHMSPQGNKAGVKETVGGCPLIRKAQPSAQGREVERSRKCKFWNGEEDWMNTPITFPPIPSDDVSDEPLISETEVEGYLIRRVFLDQALPEEQPNEGAAKCRESSIEEEGMINTVFPDQKVTIGTRFSLACRLQLITLLKDNKDVFAWQPADMVGVNMKFYLKKCSFGVEEGKFLHYMVMSEGIQANPKKTKAVADMQSPKTLKEMQSLSGKRAALNRFLSRSAGQQAFQKFKKLIMELLMLTTPGLKETLYVYLAASKEAVSGVLIADRKGKQASVWYISRILHEAERNYAPLEKLVLCLLYLSRRLRSLTNDENLIDPTGIEYTYAIRLNFTSTNNKAEYEALLTGLWIAGKMKVQALKVKVDSKVVACQLNGEFVANNDGMTNGIQSFNERDIGRGLKRKVSRGPGNKRHCRGRMRQLDDPNYQVPRGRCVGPLQASYIIREVHEGACEMHVGAQSVVAKTMRQGYYWPSMHRDTKEVVDRCDSCQIHGPVPRPLPEGPGRLKFIIVTIDYFTKWMEAKPLAKNTAVVHPQANDLVERANKSLMHGLKARLGRERVGWWNEAHNEEEMRLNLDLIQERKETAAIREAKYKKKVEQYYKKWVRPVSFRVGDFVYQRNEASRIENQGKLDRTGKARTGCGYEFCYTCAAEWKNKKATCSSPLWDEGNIVAERDRENLLVVVREVEAECDAVEVKMKRKRDRGDHVVKKRKLIHPEEDTNMDELRVRIDHF